MRPKSTVWLSHETKSEGTHKTRRLLLQINGLAVGEGPGRPESTCYHGFKYHSAFCLVRVLTIKNKNVTRLHCYCKSVVANITYPMPIFPSSHHPTCWHRCPIRWQFDSGFEGRTGASRRLAIETSAFAFVLVHSCCRIEPW